MPQDIDRQIAESLDATPDLLPFLPELLADWTSSPPDEVLRFLEPLELPPTTRALDLGCGKGAVALALAERLGFYVVAVDAFPPFVEECRRRAEDKRLGHRCEFYCGDLRGWLGLVCSPRFDPGVMRVSTAPRWGQETHDEEEAAFAGADHPKAA